MDQIPTHKQPQISPTRKVPLVLGSAKSNGYKKDRKGYKLLVPQIVIMEPTNKVV